MAEDWNKPITTDAFAEVLSVIVSHFDGVRKFEFTDDTNLNSGDKRWNSTLGRFEQWNGSTWTDLQTNVTAHLASTSNPHSVTAAQVGAPTTSQLNAHTGNTSNPHSVTAAQVGAPTTSQLNAHTGNTSNPHNVTYGQIGACSIHNNLSDLDDVNEARSVIGAASAATVSSHIANTSNPHSVTAAQVGAFKISNNLSEGTPSTCRVNIGAASSGANRDITSLTAVQTITRSGGMIIGPTSNNALLLQTQNGSRGVYISAAGDVYPVVHNSNTLGTSSRYWSSVYTVGINGIDTAVLNLNSPKEGIQFSRNSTARLLLEEISGAERFRPSTNLGVYLGTNSYKYAAVYAAAYNTFTGCHLFDEIEEDIQIGDFVAIGKNKKLVKLTQENAAAGIGIYQGILDGKHQVAAVGDSDTYKGFNLPVCDAGGDINIGTLLCASEFAGILKAQSDDIIRSTTMAKALECACFDKQGKANIYGVIYSG